MMTGIVNSTREAIVAIELRGRAERSEELHAVLDTGFTGCILVPQQTVDTLRLSLITCGQALLADGQIVGFDVYDGTVFWHGAWRRVEVLVTANNADPLIGMELLQGSRIRMGVCDGGAVAIVPLDTLRDSGISTESD